MTHRLVLLLLLGCGAATPAPDVRERAPGGLEPIDPGTTSAELLSAAACARCHEAEHAEWKTSRHALAWTNGIFQREYRDEPRQWCVNCHAPTAPQVAEARTHGGGPLADEGVGCAACHVRGGRIVAAARAASSPHDTLVRPGFGGADTCAGCHEFGFPVIDDDGEVRALTAHPMQATVTQFRRGPFADARDGCLTCHGGGTSGHAFPGAHDPGMLERALRFDVCRDGVAVVMSIENHGAGHNVPTGDVHRHINVRAWRSSAPERLHEIFLGRRFTPLPGGGKETTWDSTLAPGATQRHRVEASALGGDGPIRFEVRYVYTVDENPRPHRDPGEPVSRVIAERSATLEELPTCTPR